MIIIKSKFGEKDSTIQIFKPINLSIDTFNDKVFVSIEYAKTENQTSILKYELDESMDEEQTIEITTYNDGVKLTQFLSNQSYE